VKSATHRLLAVLETEEQVYLRLRNLLQRERELMVQLDADGLECLAREKEVLADEGRLVEESRQVVAAELTRALGFPEPRPTLSRICQGLGDAAGPLREAHTRLLVLVSVVRELLDANAVLAGDCLEQVRGTLRLLGGLLPGEGLYGPAPNRADPAEAGRLLQRTA
jgi:hypothetical protein